MKKVLQSGVALALGLGLSPPSMAQSVFFDVNGDSIWDPIIIAPVGSTVSADIFTDIDDTHGGLVGWGLEVNYESSNAALLNPCCETGSDWNLPEDIDDSTLGSVSMVDGRIGSGIAAPPPVYLGTISFEITNGGPWVLSMQNVFPNDPNFDGFVAADGFVYDDTLNFLSSQVNVPIPAAVWLFASGLVSLIGFTRRK